MVFAGIYPVDTEDYEELRASMEKLAQRCSVGFQPESSAALVWFPLWFLGNVALRNHSRALGARIQHDGYYYRPNVSYQAYTKEPDTIVMVNNPSDLPEPSTMDRVRAIHTSSIITKADFVGNVMSLCMKNEDKSPIKPISPLSE